MHLWKFKRNKSLNDKKSDVKDFDSEAERKSESKKRIVSEMKGENL